MPPGAGRSLFAAGSRHSPCCLPPVNGQVAGSLKLHGNWRRPRPAHRAALHDAAHDLTSGPAEVIYAWSTTCATKPSSPRSQPTKPSGMNPPPAQPSPKSPRTGRTRHPEHHRPRRISPGGVISRPHILVVNAAIMVILSAGQHLAREPTANGHVRASIRAKWIHKTANSGTFRVEACLVSGSSLGLQRPAVAESIRCSYDKHVRTRC
jgi:hypothetical protein